MYRRVKPNLDKNLTVKELREKLAQFPDNAKVLFEADYCGLHPDNYGNVEFIKISYTDLEIRDLKYLKENNKEGHCPDEFVYFFGYCD